MLALLVGCLGVVLCDLQLVDALAQVSPQDQGWGAAVSLPSKAPPIPRDGAALPGSAVDVPSKGVVINSAAVEGDAQRTRLAFGITGPVGFAISRLSKPYRVVVDLDHVTFQLPAGTGRQGSGLVTAYRFGLFAQGKTRVVIDTAGPTRVESARIVPAAAGHRLEIELAATTATEFAAAELASAAHAIELPEAAAAESPPPRPQAGTDRARPVVVIDPGHGGIDPGAIGSRGSEKDIVLAVALQVRKSLMSTRRYDVVMTRTTDAFVALDQRVKISQRANADLFVSIHADSLDQKDIAQNIRGASVYALSERASDERSRRLAEKENAADLFAGIGVQADKADGQVRDILFDLMRRESHTFSNEFRGILAGHLRQKLRLAKDPMKSAPFRVLRQPGSPAVLIELGYMSNAEDEILMASAEWQTGVADAITKAISSFFQKHPPAQK